MSDKPQVHPQEPSEGGEEDEQAPGAEQTSGKEEASQDVGTEERSCQHPQEPPKEQEKMWKTRGPTEPGTSSTHPSVATRFAHCQERNPRFN